MLGYFDKVFQRVMIDTDKTPLGQQLARMAAYDFDPRDITPDQIDKLVADVKNFFSSEDMTFSNTEVGASASFCGFGGSASAKFTRQELRKRMEDKGWKFETVGKLTVPKSFEVNVVNDTVLRSEGAISGTVLREQLQFARFNHRVSTANVYYPQAAKDALVELENLKAEVLKLHQQANTTDVAVKELNSQLSARILKLAEKASLKVQYNGSTATGLRALIVVDQAGKFPAGPGKEHSCFVPVGQTVKATFQDSAGGAYEYGKEIVDVWVVPENVEAYFNSSDFKVSKHPDNPKRIQFTITGKRPGA